MKLPDTDRQMIQPETSREDIRELKRFNKTEPAAGVADDISQLVEKFYQDNELILNAVYSEEFDEQTINRFIEIVNPAGNRSYKKGLYFMMMYENRVTFKKFGDTPKDMTWWEFYQLTREIFDDTAAGPKTWQNHFGGADDEETTVQDTADEPGREETATEAPEPEDDGGAVGETGADDVQEIEKGGMEDHGAADEAGTGQEEDDYLAAELEKIGLKRLHDGEFFHEFVTTCDKPQAVLDALDKAGILGGLPVEGGILWCVTEMVSREELDRAVAIIKEVC